VLIEVESTSDPDHYPDEIAVVDFEGWPDLDEVNRIRRRVLNLYSETDRYTVEITVSEFEWGASAGDVVLMISIAADLIVLWPGLRAVFDWATRAHRETERLTAESAEHAAAWRIASRWDVSVANLTKLAEEQTAHPQGWKFVFTDDRGVTYRATAEATKSGIPITYVAADWTAIGGPPVRRRGDSATSELQDDNPH
jgi:hypothetical protein